MNSEKKSAEVRHPGAELADVLALVDMSRKELSKRTGVSEKHIEAVIGGSRDISIAFAKLLETALDLPAHHWLDLQIRYEEYLFEKKESADIEPEELELLPQLASVLPYLKENGLLPDSCSDTEAIPILRRFMGVSNLCSIENIAYTTAYRARFRGCGDIDPFLLMVWQQMCAWQAKDIKTAPSLDVKKLRDSLTLIKHLMFYGEDGLPFQIQKSLAPFGIAFRLFRPAEELPIRSYTRRLADGRALICLPALRQRQDVFWTLLFREIARLLKGKGNCLEFFSKEENRTKADEDAEELLVPASRYLLLTARGDFSFETIRRFAESQIVPEHILLGRLVRDGFIKEDEEIRAHLPEYCWNEE